MNRNIELMPLSSDVVDGVRYDIQEEKKIGCVILDRPPLNIVSYSARQRINDIIEALDKDERVSVIVIRGANGVFTSGGDVKEFPRIPLDRMSDLGINVGAPARSRKPTVALLEKYALGVGFEIALACDLRYATSDTLVGLPEAALGQMPGSGGSQRLVRIVGMTRAKEMLLLGKKISAEEALGMGLLNGVWADSGQMEEEVDKVCATLRTLSGNGLSTLKQVINEGAEMPLEAAISFEGQAYEKLRSTIDYKEGIAAFAEKRKPLFNKGM